MSKKKFEVTCKEEVYYTTVVEAESEEQANEIAENLWDKDIPIIQEKTKHFVIDTEGGSSGIVGCLTKEITD